MYFWLAAHVVAEVESIHVGNVPSPAHHFPDTPEWMSSRVNCIWGTACPRAKGRLLREDWKFLLKCNYNLNILHIIATAISLGPNGL